MMAESTNQEAQEHWGKSLYQFDEEYANGIAKQNKDWQTTEIIPRISHLLSSVKEYKILAVGSGTGFADRVVLELISEHIRLQGIKGPKLVYTVVEPDKEALEVCKRNLGSVGGLDIEFQWEPVTMEEYFKRDPNKFEMVHFIHSLCEVSRCAKVFPEILRKNYVRDDGILFSVLGDHDKNFFLKLYFANKDKLCKGGEGGAHEHHNHDAHHHHHHHHDSHHHSEDSHQKGLHNIVRASDVEKLEKVIKDAGWSFKIFSRILQEDVTELMSLSKAAIHKLGLRIGIKEIDKVLSKEDLDEIIKQIDVEAERKTVNGKEKRFGKSINHIVIVYHE